MLMTFVIASCNSEYDDDKKINGNQLSSDTFVGLWYEETQNKEDSYNSSGLFYSKFCNTINQGELNGKYFVDSDNNKLTWIYDVEGTTLTSNWIITDVTDLGFTMSSDEATLTYGMIVDVFRMEGGDSNQITFNTETVYGYESNSNIAKVSSNGIVTATGEKGTAYIKVKLNNKNVWVKVIVGNDTPDLWMDYSNLLNCDIAAIKDTLGMPSKSQDSDDFTKYTYITSSHNILEYVDVSVDNVSRFIKQIDLHIKEGVAKEKILAYMNSRYYKIEGDYGTQYRYSTSPTMDDSRAAFIYDIENKSIAIMSKDNYVTSQMVDDLFDDYVRFINKTRLTMAEMMGSKEPTRQYNNQCDYVISNNQYISRVVFFYTNKGVVKNGIQGIMVDVKSNANQNEIIKYLSSIYTATLSEEKEKNFISKDNNVDISYVVDENGIFIYYTPMGTYTDPEADSYPQLWIDYSKYFGLTHDELLAILGTPVYDYGSPMMYTVVNDYLYGAYFYFDENNKVWAFYLMGNDTVDSQIFIDALGKRYAFVETGTNDNGFYYRWRNADDINAATIQITFYPESNRIAYQLL